MTEAGVRRDTISPSQLRAMGCRLQWYWSYPQGYRAIRAGDALELGIGIHEGLDGYYQGKGHPAEIFNKWAAKRIIEINSQWEDDLESMKSLHKLGKSMLEEYFNVWNGNDNFEVLATEKTLRRPLPTPADGEGDLDCDVVVRLDGLVRCDKTKKLYSLEHKTFSRFSQADLEVDQQFTAQVWVGQELAKEMGLSESVEGVIYNGLRKQAPGPRVKLALFERQKLYRNQSQIDAFLYRAYWQYADSKTWKIFPQPDPRKCGMCDFKEPCTELQRGGDYQFLLDNNYTRREADHAEEIK